MDFPKYNGTISPDDWLNQVQTKCILNSIKNEKEILQLCKLNIVNSIKIPDNINNTTDLIKALKAHPSFSIFKNDCKAKLDNMKFEGGDSAKFLADARGLCNNAEIISNPDEVRKRLLNTYSSNEFFRNEFAKRVTRNTTPGDMFKIYSEVVSDGTKVINYGPETKIVLKHVVSGRYLTSSEINYQTGSERQVVHCGEKLPSENAVWFISYENAPQRDKYQVNTILYEDLIKLNHQKTGTTLSLNDYYKAPKTGNAEVHCHKFISSELRFTKPSQSTNKTSYLKVGDIVHIKSENEKNGAHTMSSHDSAKFTIDGTSLQEVCGHKEKVSKDDEWVIERHR